MPKQAIDTGIQLGTVRETTSCQAASNVTAPLVKIIAAATAEGQEWERS
jgi:hypothetical protein